MLSDRVADEENAHADTTADAQSRVALFAQEAQEMAGMMGRLKERLGKDGAVVSKVSFSASTRGGGAGLDRAVDLDDPVEEDEDAAGGYAIKRAQAARVAATTEKLAAMTDLVGLLTDGLRGVSENKTHKPSADCPWFADCLWFAGFF